MAEKMGVTGLCKDAMNTIVCLHGCMMDVPWMLDGLWTDKGCSACGNLSENSQGSVVPAM